MLTITPVYASLLIALIVFLAYRVSGFRRSEAIPLGDDAGSKAMKSAVRAHGNAVENIPAALLLLLMLELNQLAPWMLHLFGVVFLTARVLHAMGLSQKAGPSFGRFYGTVLSWVCMIAMIVVNLLIVLSR